jgi:hypothetical protein
MNRIYTTIMLLIAAVVPVQAQRLDGCVAQKDTQLPLTLVGASSREAMDRGLQDSGVVLTRGALAAALGSPKPDVRSLAAMKLGEIGKKDDLAPLMQAWLAETDTCTKVAMLQDITQHPGGQPWVTPFQTCNESAAPLVKLTVEQVDALGAGPTVRISARNQTQQTIAFAKNTPPELFSVTVLDPIGVQAKVMKGKEWMYDPTYRIGGVLIGRSPAFVPLPPQQDVPLWDWKVGEDFDMSAPGTYRVSLGGWFAYLNTTICSNVAAVIAGK